MSWFSKKKNILVLGIDGMLGYDVYKKLCEMSQQKDSVIGTVIGFNREEIDSLKLCERHGLGDYFMNSIHFDYCVNCIAMTDTKSAETTAEGRNLSYKLNTLLPKWFAESCAYRKVHLIHISTDYVFSQHLTSPRLATQFSDETEDKWPVDIYGTHKLLGEQFIKEEFAEKKSKKWTILRTSWLYGEHNNKSFVHKCIKNFISCMRDNKTIEATENEMSFPTSTRYVVDCIVKVIEDNICGVTHAVCTSIDVATRADWVQAIACWISNTPEAHNILGNLWKKNGKLLDNIKPVKRDTYQPEFSAMCCSSEFNHVKWNAELYEFLKKRGLDIIEWAMKS